jgi:hypothetical protein
VDKLIGIKRKFIFLSTAIIFSILFIHFIWTGDYMNAIFALITCLGQVLLVLGEITMEVTENTKKLMAEQMVRMDADLKELKK